MRRLAFLLSFLAAAPLGAQAPTARDTAHAAAQARLLKLLDTETRRSGSMRKTQARAWADTLAKNEAKLLAAPVVVVNRPPTAAFTVVCVPAPATIDCTFDARGSSDPEGPTDYSWSFDVAPRPPDTSSAVVRVTYPHGGVRNVALRVTDLGGLSNTVTKAVTVPEPSGVVPTPAPAPVPTPVPPIDSGITSTTVTAAPPELPRSTPNLVVPTPTGKTIRVAAGGDLQAALSLALPGDVVALAPGATFTGGFVLPAKPCTGWITLRTDTTDAALPPDGVRMTPAAAVRARLAKLITPDNQPALRTAIPTCQWRVFAIEITGTLPMVSIQYGLAASGDGGWVGGGEKQTTLALVPQDIVLDRVYIHGTPTLNTTRCLALNSGRTAVVNSWLSECHAKGFDSQAIEGWNGPGPYLIENNHLAGAGENVMFGGADPNNVALIPADITIRRNHVWKDPAWKGVWSVKNLFELKNARRVLVENNVFENNWTDGQSGMAIVIKSTTDVCGTGCMWEGTTDVMFRGNIVRNSPRGFNAQAFDDSYVPTGTNVHVQRVAVEQNLFTQIGTFNGTGTDGWLVLLTHDLADVAITANTFVGNTPDFGVGVYLAYAAGGQMRRLSIQNNILAGQSYLGFFADGGAIGTAAFNAQAGASWTVRGNVVTEVDPEYQAAHPVGNTYLASVASLGLLTTGSLPVGSPYAGKGADIAALLRATAGVIVSP